MYFYSARLMYFCSAVDRHDVIGDPTYADAILDRLSHNAHRIELSGESLRRGKGKQPNKA